MQHPPRWYVYGCSRSYIRLQPLVRTVAGPRSTQSASEIHLIDFGLATHATATAASRSDMLKGTPTFASLAAHYSRRPMRPVDDIESLVYTLAYLAVGGLPWEDLPEPDVASMKKAAITEGCHIFTDRIHSASLADALHAMWAEVMRCRGDGREPVGSPSRAANVDYDACHAALMDFDVPYDWEERGQETPSPKTAVGQEPPYWSA